MGVFDIFKISASGMKAQRIRMDTIASNLANVQTTKTDEGGPYKKKEVVFKTVDVSEDSGFRQALARQVDGVHVDGVRESDKPFQQVYNPGHPDADEKGYVTLSNVNMMEEMTDMTAAARAYEANVNVLTTTKDMFIKTLELIK